VGNGDVSEHDGNHLIPGEFATTTNRIRDFGRLTQGISHASAAVTDDHQRAEIETASAFDDFGGAIDEDDLLGQFFTAAFFEGIFRRVARRATTAAASPLTAIAASIATLSRFIKFSHSVLWVTG
jgi:hypothetical protein